MLKSTKMVINRLHSYKFLQHLSQNVQKRNVSALYITGDKAKEQYATIQPYTDFENTFGNIEALEMSIQKRKMQIDVKEVIKMYDKYNRDLKEIQRIEDDREMIVKQLKAMSKSQQNDKDLIEQLKAKGRDFKNEYKSKKADFYPVEDEFMQSFLHLPNLLHPHCPEGDFERILFRSRLQEHKEAKPHLNSEKYIEFIDNTRYYMKNKAALFDIYATDSLTTYFRNKGGFIQTANPDFVRCVLLEANASPLEHYHKVMEAHLQNSLNGAYLTGGASFESYLGAVTKLCVYPNVIPLKYVCSGRLYERTLSDHTPSLYTATQTNAVQTFVANRNQQEAEEQMDNVLNMCVNFYKNFPNLHFRVVYVKASDLTPSESLRAQIELYSPYEKRYICVGRVSNYSDFVSKRILFTMREHKQYHFLHLIGGPVLFTSRLIAALIECEEPLDYEKLLKFSKLNKSESNGDDVAQNAIDKFKSLFN